LADGWDDVDARECGEAADFLCGAGFADAGGAPEEGGGAVAAAGLLDQGVQLGEFVFVADEDGVDRVAGLGEAVGDADAEQFGRDADDRWAASSSRR
jgi:hypothetical protein